MSVLNLTLERHNTWDDLTNISRYINCRALGAYPVLLKDVNRSNGSKIQLRNRASTFFSGELVQLRRKNFVWNSKQANSKKIRSGAKVNKKEKKIKMSVSLNVSREFKVSNEFITAEKAYWNSNFSLSSCMKNFSN